MTTKFSNIDFNLDSVILVLVILTWAIPFPPILSIILTITINILIILGIKKSGKLLTESNIINSAIFLWNCWTIYNFLLYITGK